MTSPSPSNSDYTTLPHHELNPSASQTILFIHGAQSTSSSFNLITPFLPAYHILLPDLPGHGIAAHLPFSISSAAAALRSLILTRAHGQKAYLVGFSLGAHVAMSLVSQYPELADCVLVSGFQVFASRPLGKYLPHAIWAGQKIEAVFPRSWVRWAMDGIDVPRADPNLCTVEYFRKVFGTHEDAEHWPHPWPARCLVIAAGKGGLVPSNDSLDDARRLAEIGKKRNAQTKAVVHPDMRHPWIWQAPELFAETVRVWFEEGKVPDGFVSLDDAV